MLQQSITEYYHQCVSVFSSYTIILFLGFADCFKLNHIDQTHVFKR